MQELFSSCYQENASVVGGAAGFTLLGTGHNAEPHRTEIESICYLKTSFNYSVSGTQAHENVLHWHVVHDVYRKIAFVMSEGMSAEES